jgi:hypothetical protein
MDACEEEVGGTSLATSDHNGSMFVELPGLS